MVKSKSEKVFDAANIVLMIVLTVVFVVPILLIVSASFTSARALTKYGYSLIIREFSWSSYSYIFLASDIFVRSLFNSVFMTVYHLSVRLQPYAKTAEVQKALFDICRYPHAVCGRDDSLLPRRKRSASHEYAVGHHYSLFGKCVEYSPREKLFFGDTRIAHRLSLIHI